MQLTQECTRAVVLLLENNPRAMDRLHRQAQLAQVVGDELDAVVAYLQGLGYRIIPVNPNAHGEILGEPVVGRLTEVAGRTKWANMAYFYIGMSHYNLKNWNKAIDSLSLVGTEVEKPNVYRLVPCRVKSVTEEVRELRVRRKMLGGQKERLRSK